jgi:hypothetical protein
MWSVRQLIWATDPCGEIDLLVTGQIRSVRDIEIGARGHGPGGQTET